MKTREWQVAVVDVGGGRQKIESVAHWHIGCELITVREVRKVEQETEQEKFNAFAKSIGCTTVMSNGEYYDHDVRLMWQAWQAAKSE